MEIVLDVLLVCRKPVLRLPLAKCSNTHTVRCNSLIKKLESKGLLELRLGKKDSFRNYQVKKRIWCKTTRKGEILIRTAQKLHNSGILKVNLYRPFTFEGGNDHGSFSSFEPRRISNGVTVEYGALPDSFIRSSAHMVI